jgi:hypothetical protein
LGANALTDYIGNDEMFPAKGAVFGAKKRKTGCWQKKIKIFGFYNQKNARSFALYYRGRTEAAAESFVGK